MFNVIGSIGTHASLAALPNAALAALVSFPPQTSDVVDRGAAGGLSPQEMDEDGLETANKVDFRSSDITGSKRSPHAVNGSFPVPGPGQGFDQSRDSSTPKTAGRFVRALFPVPSLMYISN